MANNDFAVGMYQQISNSPGNFLFSPFSIEAGLAMASAGAQKETLTQMLQTLHLPANSHAEFTNLLKELKGLTDTQLLTANRIWGRTGGDYSPSFLQSLHENYGADLSPLDFMKDAAKSRYKSMHGCKLKRKIKLKTSYPRSRSLPTQT
jgi:serpin B